ncbi:PTS sugar transporter subunit IIA [Companilactobacillus kedongensis]|uniref:PTS sugar transporter subunit IIA n=1 Tax=Companilactobacillus kedongensis TaxID=2486004 RepID=UPI000F7857C8|nr:PTS sugar transporter subunit IIA [Companilactobacillus kedongensis]
MMKLNKNNVYANLPMSGYDEVKALSLISYAVAKKLNISEQEVKSSFLAREATNTSSIGQKIAMPKASASEVSDPQVFVFTSEMPIDWLSVDKKPVNIFVAIVAAADVEIDYDGIKQKLLNNANALQDAKVDPDQLTDTINDLLLQGVES